MWRATVPKGAANAFAKERMTRWTEQDLANYCGRRGLVEAVLPAVETTPAPFHLPANEAGAFARGALKPDGMNKLEAEYAQHLELLKHAGEILWWRYEAIRLRLADGSWFRPDFFVLTKDCHLEVRETKGFMREAANVRLKVAAGIFPFRFVLVRRIKNGWEETEV